MTGDRRRWGRLTELQEAIDGLRQEVPGGCRRYSLRHAECWLRVGREGMRLLVMLSKHRTHDAVAGPGEGAAELGPELHEDLLLICVLFCHRCSYVKHSADACNELSAGFYMQQSARQQCSHRHLVDACGAFATHGRPTIGPSTADCSSVVRT